MKKNEKVMYICKECGDKDETVCEDCYIEWLVDVNDKKIEKGDNEVTKDRERWKIWKEKRNTHSFSIQIRRVNCHVEFQEFNAGRKADKSCCKKERSRKW